MFLTLLTYTCQLFRRYKREIFILGVLGFLKTTRSFLKIPEEVWSLPKTSEVCISLPKASSLPVLFTSKIRDRKEGIAIYSFYRWFSFLTWVWVNIFLEIMSSRTATTHIFQSGVRNWPAGVSRCEIEVFNPQAWELAGILTVNVTKRALQSQHPDQNYFFLNLDSFSWLIWYTIWKVPYKEPRFPQF